MTINEIIGRALAELAMGLKPSDSVTEFGAVGAAVVKALNKRGLVIVPSLLIEKLHEQTSGDRELLATIDNLLAVARRRE